MLKYTDYLLKTYLPYFEVVRVGFLPFFDLAGGLPLTFQFNSSNGLVWLGVCLVGELHRVSLLQVTNSKNSSRFAAQSVCLSFALSCLV